VRTTRGFSRWLPGVVLGAGLWLAAGGTALALDLEQRTVRDVEEWERGFFLPWIKLGSAQVRGQAEENFTLALSGAYYREAHLAGADIPLATSLELGSTATQNDWRNRWWAAWVGVPGIKFGYVFDYRDSGGRTYSSRGPAFGLSLLGLEVTVRTDSAFPGEPRMVSFGLAVPVAPLGWFGRGAAPASCVGAECAGDAPAVTDTVPLPVP